MKLSVLLILVLFMFIGCDLEEECPSNCTTKVVSPNGQVIECHCPN